VIASVSFLLAAGLCLAAAFVAVRRGRGPRRAGWMVLGAALVVLSAAMGLAAWGAQTSGGLGAAAGVLALSAALGLSASLIRLRPTIVGTMTPTPPGDRLQRMMGRGWDVLVLLDERGHVLYATESVTRVLGYTLDEYVGSSPFGSLHPDDTGYSAGRFRELLRTPGDTVRTEVRSRHKNGEWRWLEILATNLQRDPDFRAIAVNYRDITDRHAAEEALRFREREMRSLADNAPTIIVRFDRQLRHVFVNRAIESKTGIPVAAFLGKTHAELGMPAEVTALWTDTLRRVFERGAEEVLEFEFPTPQGLVYFRSRVVPELDEQGGVQTVLVIADDITERRQAEKELQRSLSLVRATLESTADGILVVDREGHILDFNQRFAEMWRIPEAVLAARRDELAVQSVLGDLENPEAFLAKVRSMYDEPDAESYDIVRFKDGRLFERYSLPQRVEGESVGRVWSFRDITAEREAEAALRKSEASYRALVDHATYGIYRSTPDGHFQSANPAIVKMLGYETEADLLALDVASDVYVTPDLRARLIDQYRNSDRVEGVEVEWRRRDGSMILVRLSGRPVHAADGSVESFEMIAEDITEQRALEAQLRQAQKMEAVGQLTGGIAHDFNNLLTVILANADILDRGFPGDRPDLREDLAELRKAAQRGGDMIRKLLGFSRREVLVLKPVALSAVVGNLMPMLRRVLPETIDVRFTPRDTGDGVRADEGALEQILLNLATNARDAMPDGGRLRIEIARDQLERDHQAVEGFGRPGDYVRLGFSDSGIGMDESTLERIFDPFFTTKPPGVGTGLGMAMIYGLVKQQHGFIDVKSRPGEGTTVHIYLPIAGVPTADPRPSGTRAPSGDAEGTETILLVEDEPAIRRAAKRLLEKKGYTVLLAENGIEALEVVQRHGDSIDLIISDVVMPRMGGVPLYHALQERNLHVPFMFTSGYALRDVRDGIPTDAGVPFVHKPWDVNDLLGRVREVLDLR
jgi:PAS domain S-box-containing protein